MHLITLILLRAGHRRFKSRWVCCICSHLSLSLTEQQIQDYNDGHDTQWFGQFNLLRWYALIDGSSSYLIYQSVTFQVARKALLTVQDQPTNRLSFTRGFLPGSFKSGTQNYVDVQCCLARNGRSCAVRYVECDVRTMDTYLGISIRATGNNKIERRF